MENIDNFPSEQDPKEDSPSIKKSPEKTSVKKPKTPREEQKEI